jgi:hypothetical protein
VCVCSLYLINKFQNIKKSRKNILLYNLLQLHLQHHDLVQLLPNQVQEEHHQLLPVTRCSPKGAPAAQSATAPSATPESTSNQLATTPKRGKKRLFDGKI